MGAALRRGRAGAHVVGLSALRRGGDRALADDAPPGRGRLDGIRRGASRGRWHGTSGRSQCGPAAQPGAVVSGDPIEAFVSAAAALDGDRIEAALDELFGRGSFESIVDAWLMPAAAALGDAWAAGRVTVAGEHAASAALGRRLAGAFEAAARVDGRPVVVGLPPGSRHELGALAFATALRRRGVAVLYVGADVPVASWLDVRARLQPRLLVVAVVTADDRPAAIDVATALRRDDDGTPVAFGGRAAAGAATEVAGSRSCPIRSSPPRIARWHCSRPDGLRPGIMVRPP